MAEPETKNKKQRSFGAKVTQTFPSSLTVYMDLEFVTFSGLIWLNCRKRCELSYSYMLKSLFWKGQSDHLWNLEGPGGADSPHNCVPFCVRNNSISQSSQLRLNEHSQARINLINLNCWRQRKITKEKVLLLWWDEPGCDHHSTSSRETSPRSIPWAGEESHCSG